jgi:branched-chain amino acid transport system permease protein
VKAGALRNVGAMAALLIAPVVFALSAGGYEQRIMTLAGIYAIAVLGYQLIFGRLGALSLAQGSFFGIGAYTTGLLGIHLDWAFPASFLASLVIPAAIACIIAIPVLRLESHYFALATLGISQIALLIGVNWTEGTGGANGLYGVPPIRILGATLDSSEAMLVVVWCVLAGAVLAFSWVVKGRAAHRLTLLREAPEAAATAGIDIGARRLSLFVASAALGGAAGGLQAHSIGVVSPAVLEFQVMVSILAMTVIGGRGHPAGAILGAVLLVHLPEWFRFLEAHYLVAYGAALLVAVIVMPEGLAGLFRRWLVTQERWPPEPPSTSKPEAKLPQLSSAAMGAPTALATLHLVGLCKRYGGIVALNNVSLTVAPGEILGLIGPNGSGKSTLINVASGLQSLEAGKIRLGDLDLTEMPAHGRARAGLSRTFQTPVQALGLSPLESVLAACPAGFDDRRAERHAKICLRAAELTALAAPTTSLSPAEARRLDIARALASGPAVLLLDEPAAGLTPAERDDLARCLKRLADNGLGLLLVDHTMDFLLPLADRMICLATGSVVAEGPPSIVARDPAAIAAYFGEASP